MTAPGMRTEPEPTLGPARAVGARRVRAASRRRRLLAVGVIAMAALAGCTFGPPPPDAGGAPPNLPSPTLSSSAPSGGDGSAATADVLARHLASPWGLAFLPDGSALVTERKSATIVRVGPPQHATGLTVTPIATVSGVDTSGDGGLLGIAVSPKVASDGTVYVYYSTATNNRIGTIKLRASALVAPPETPSAPPSQVAPSQVPPVPSPPTAPIRPIAVTPHPVVTGIPHGATDNGGWLAFGPDGTLYASTGDAGHPSLSPDPKSLGGKILRMTPAGKPVAGASLIYATGLHNVQGFAWDQDNQLFAVDSADSGDGVIPIRLSADYGWPPSSRSEGDATVQPIQTFPLAQGGCAGVAAVQQILATACLTGQRVWLMQIAGNAVFGSPQAGLTQAFGRLRTVVAAPDGSLWITTSNTDGHGKPSSDDDQIIRVVIADEGAGKS